jgi:small subunit ribosomal protein S16
VAKLLKITGDWQKHKGIPGAEGRLKVAEPKRDKLEIFNEALKEAGNEPKGEAVTKKSAKKAEPKAEETPAAEAPAEETPAEAAPAEESAAETAPAEVPASETPEGAAEEAEAAETVTAEDAGKSES